MAATTPVHWELENTTFRPCIDEDDIADPCAGGVHMFSSLSGASTWPRCNKHQDAYVERTQPRLDEIAERWGSQDSEIAPDWFDPTACGERWNEDDPW